MVRREKEQLSYESISPVDNRYYDECKELSAYFSEAAFIAERVSFELDYLRLLIDNGVAPRERLPEVKVSIDKIKSIELEVGHDVKAIELYIREELRRLGSEKLIPYVHLALTSEDTNSVSFARLIIRALSEVVIPCYERLAYRLAELAESEAETRMLARTHGRAALPTTFGKEIAVFAIRLAERISRLKSIKPVAKISGAVGTYASFYLMKNTDWPQLLKSFVNAMGLEYAEYTTQIAPGERLSDIAHIIININQIMLSLARDLWLYQMLDYLHFTREGKISSSTMPQKENPVDIENAEGQIEISNSLLMMIAYRLQLNRLQRDLSDSVIRRMLGQALAHSIIACKRVLRSLDHMEIRRDKMSSDLNSHLEVYAEAAQLMLRLRGDERGYEEIREAIERGETSIFQDVIRDVGPYIGLASELAKKCKDEVSRLTSSKA